MPDFLDKSIVKILNPDGEVEGTGFLVSSNGVILTCSHVLLHQDEQTDISFPKEVSVVFLADKEKKKNIAHVKFCLPTIEGDIAVLQLKETLPKNCQWIPLGLMTNVENEDLGVTNFENEDFFTRGFPQINTEVGIPAIGKITGYTEVYGVEALTLENSAITAGFSGAPMVLKNIEAIIGMLVTITSKDKFDKQGDSAFAISSQALVKAYPELKKYSVNLDISKQTKLNTENKQVTLKSIQSFATFNNNLDKPSQTQNNSILIPDNAYVFCNREKQANQFKIDFVQKVKVKDRRPLIYFVHGEHNDVPWDFADKVKIKVIDPLLEKVYDETRGVADIIQLEKSLKADFSLEENFNLLKDTIAEKLDLISNYWSFKDLFELESLKNNKTVIINQIIHGADWNKNMEKLLDKFVSELINQILTPQAPQFIFFINITYPQPTKGWLEWIKVKNDKNSVEAYLDLITKKYNIGNGLIHRLTPVERHHITDWMRDYGRMVEKSESSIIEEIFTDRKSGEPLEKVPMNKVKDVLIMTIKEQHKIK